MTGKTHTRIGAATTVALIPVSIPDLTYWENHLSINGILDGLYSLIPFLLIMGVTWVGSLAPDLDQPGSTLTQKAILPFGKTRLSALIAGLSFMYIGKLHLFTFIPTKFNDVLVIVGFVLILMPMMKHRGITHSLIGMAIAGFGFYSLEGLGVYQKYVQPYAQLDLIWPFLIGYGAHLLADAFTETGIPLFYIPFLEKTHFRIRLPVYIRTGSVMDSLVIRYGAFAVVAFIVVGYMMA